MDGSTVRVPTERPAAAAASLMSALGADAERLVSVELGRPSLETVFIAVTGRAYRSDTDPEVEVEVEAGSDGRPDEPADRASGERTEVVQ